MNAATIVVSIDGLIIRGLSIARSQYPQLQTAVETELSRLLATHGLAQQWTQGGAIRSLPGDTIQLAPVLDPDGLGQQIAVAAFQVLGEGTK